MKRLAHILAIVIISSSCKNLTNNQNGIVDKFDTQDTVSYQSDSTVLTTDNLPSKDVISTRDYAQMILDEKVKPSHNEETFKCLSKLISEDTTEREFYFQVYRKISRHADGALSEVLCGYVKTFFELNPNFCISQYHDLDSIERNIFVENIAFEFYASGVDYQADIEEYFDQIQRKLGNTNKEILGEIKDNVITNVAKLND